LLRNIIPPFHEYGWLPEPDQIQAVHEELTRSQKK
jgi:hypothetical protein